MAEMLIRLHAKASGDIVAIMPDGHQWGIREVLPNFTVIQFDDVKETELIKYTFPGSGQNVFYKRQWKVDFSLLSSDVQSKLLDDSSKGNVKLIVGSGIKTSCDITWDDFSTAIYNKLDTKTEKDNNYKLLTQTDKTQQSKSDSVFSYPLSLSSGTK